MTAGAPEMRKGFTFASPIGFGASGIGTLYKDVPDTVAHETLAAAYDGGMRYFDTAPLYGHGLSELRLGRFLRTVPRESVTVSTKVGRCLVPPRGQPVDYGLWAAPLRLKLVFDYSYDGTMRALEQSASRLGFPDFDVVYIHDVDRYSHGADGYKRRFDQAMAGSYRALDELRRSGEVKAIGVGVNESDIATRFVEAGRFDVVMIAGRYSLLDRSATLDLFPAAEKAGTGIVSAAVFNSGLLAKGPKFNEATYDYGAPPTEVIQRAEAISRICEAHDVPLQAAAIQFPLRSPIVCAIVLGMSQPDRVPQNIEWSRYPIPEVFWQEIETAFTENWASRPKKQSD
ncbi:hypothetical protein N185_16750 [Sinorhizobium sp. GW3]|nr:hypothetical protein N185_16750 [Sinorhizobium sp. GW3]